jgi:transcriptional regulator with XRE-family HTH domain
MTPEQSRMARAGLGLGVRELADAARVSTNTVIRFERGEVLGPRTLDAIMETLENAGIQFIGDGEESLDGGIGVRLKRRSSRKPKSKAGTRA